MLSCLQFLPGIFATMAIIMINATGSGDTYASMDDTAECRTKFWLLVSYLVSFGSVVGAVLVLVKGYAQVRGRGRGKRYMETGDTYI